MKLTGIFGLVLAVHVVGVTALLLQPGCQTTPKQETPTRPSQLEPKPLPQSGPVDDAFNAGLGNGERQPPTRPSTPVTQTPSGGFGAGEVLEPLGGPMDDVLTPVEPTETYTVQSGDTLSGIARKNGVSLNALLEANGLTKNATIFAGQMLSVPSGGGSASSPAPTLSTGGETYTVKRGDALSRIARRYGVSVNDIKAANNLSSDVIRIGQELVIPGAGSGGSLNSINAPLPSTPAPGSGSTYTVQPGDSPAAIARRFGVSTQALMSANNISDPRKLRVGQELVLPSGARASSASGSSNGGEKAQAVSQVESRPQTPARNTQQPTPAPQPIPINPPSTTPEPAGAEDPDVIDLEQLEQLGGDEAAPVIPLDDGY